VTASEFAYAQARIQARHAARAEEAEWARLHGSSTLGDFLVLARATGLRRWVAHLAPSHGAREIERSLRADFNAHVAEVASWLPERWRDATRFVARLPLLPERELSSLGSAPHAERDGDRLLDDWSSRWQSLWPHVSSSERRSLQALSDAVGRHRKEMASGDGDGWLLRAELESRLLRLFRSQRERPVSVFCHLALTALELERLRGALLRRALFQAVRSDAAWV
jgi:hypothetical protein